VLFVFARLNPGIRYVQGMNELLAPMYAAVARTALLLCIYHGESVLARGGDVRRTAVFNLTQSSAITFLPHAKTPTTARAKAASFRATTAKPTRFGASAI
jgi:hypothetical protein